MVEVVMILRHSLEVPELAHVAALRELHATGPWLCENLLRRWPLATTQASLFHRLAYFLADALRGQQSVREPRGESQSKARCHDAV